MKIYLSSTYEDLKDHRRVVFNALRQSGFQVIAMEDYVARDDRPIDACLKDVTEVDIYIGIFGLRYGYVPPPEHGNPDGLSITELEFRQADGQPNTYCLTFLLDENGQLPPKKFIDALSGENEKGECMERLRKYLQTEKTARFFPYSSPYDLASKVQSAVAKHLEKHAAGEPKNKATTQLNTWDIAKDGPPYPGLMHFTRKYASVFFGRESEVREVLDRMRLPEGRFLIISGDSGTGKSSLVDAGVLPKLEQSGLAGSESCSGVRIVPSHGDDAFDALVRSLHAVIEHAGLNPKEVYNALRENPQTMAAQLQAIIASGAEHQPLVMFLDQMEELFVNSADTKHLSEMFLTGLFVASQQNVLYAIATMRSDLLHHCYAHPDMLTVLKGQGHYPLGRMPPYALHDLIVKPAQCAGVTVPEPLSRQLIQDVGTEPGNLPLLAFALRRLFERRQDQSLSPAIYRQWGGKDLGGLKGAIAEHADEVERALCKGLDFNTDTLASHLADLFPSLVRVDLEGLPTRRRTPITAFSPELETLVQELVKARLLITEGEGENSTVSVAHERLFEAWPTLERWVVSHQDELHTLRQAELEAAEWRRHDFDLFHIWPAQRLKLLKHIVDGLQSERVSSSLREFTKPQNRLLELLNNPTLTHTQRQQVGDYLLELGDPRPGVGLRDDGIPYIEWVPIKGGQIVLEANEGVQCVENFDIARYPVTNIQFQAFIKAGDGYHNPTWRQDMPDNALNEPVSSNWQEPYCPRENISWYEAVAFCEWLSHKLGFEVRLPTEFEWQQAATGGKKERIYPWGADWDANRCNSNESRLNRTTVVGLYPHGTWPEGPLDMAGNVWEWCQNKNEQPSDCTIDKSDDMRTFRGGSWDSRDSACSCTHRDGYRPGYRYGYGFRVLRPTSSKN